jgi:hypothetical protein
VDDIAFILDIAESIEHEQSKDLLAAFIKEVGSTFDVFGFSLNKK